MFKFFFNKIINKSNLISFTTSIIRSFTNKHLKQYTTQSSARIRFYHNPYILSQNRSYVILSNIYNNCPDKKAINQFIAQIYQAFYGIDKNTTNILANSIEEANITNIDKGLGINAYAMVFGILAKQQQNNELYNIRVLPGYNDINFFLKAIANGNIKIDQISLCYRNENQHFITLYLEKNNDKYRAFIFEPVAPFTNVDITCDRIIKYLGKQLEYIYINVPNIPDHEPIQDYNTLRKYLDNMYNFDSVSERARNAGSLKGEPKNPNGFPTIQMGDGICRLLSIIIAKTFLKIPGELQKLNYNDIFDYYEKNKLYIENNDKPQIRYIQQYKDLLPNFIIVSQSIRALEYYKNYIKQHHPELLNMIISDNKNFLEFLDVNTIEINGKKINNTLDNALTHYSELTTTFIQQNYHKFEYIQEDLKKILSINDVLFSHNNNFGKDFYISKETYGLFMITIPYFQFNDSHTNLFLNYHDYIMNYNKTSSQSWVSQYFNKKSFPFMNNIQISFDNEKNCYIKGDYKNLSKLFSSIDFVIKNNLIDIMNAGLLNIFSINLLCKEIENNLVQSFFKDNIAYKTQLDRLIEQDCKKQVARSI